MHIYTHRVDIDGCGCVCLEEYYENKLKSICVNIRVCSIKRGRIYVSQNARIDQNYSGGNSADKQYNDVFGLSNWNNR